MATHPFLSKDLSQAELKQIFLRLILRKLQVMRKEPMIP